MSTDRRTMRTPLTQLLSVVLLLAAIYGAYRVIRHVWFPVHAAAVSAPPHTRTPDTSPVSIDARPITTFGDSITWGWGATRNCVPWTATLTPISAHQPGRTDTTYPGDLQRLLGQPVLDYGLPGESTPQGLQRLKAVLTAVHPSQILILEGVNDLSRSIPAAAEKDLAHMLAVVRAAGSLPVLLTLIPVSVPNVSRIPPSRVQALNALIRLLGGRDRVRVLDTYRALAGSRSLSRDGIHPTDRGYLRMSVAIARALSQPSA
jgi:lysophospholipase L1-like esterase